MLLCLLSLVRCAAVAICFLLDVVGVVFGACMCLVCCNVVVSLVLSPLAWFVISGVLSCLYRLKIVGVFSRSEYVFRPGD